MLVTCTSVDMFRRVARYVSGYCNRMMNEQVSLSFFVERIVPRNESENIRRVTFMFRGRLVCRVFSELYAFVFVPSRTTLFCFPGIIHASSSFIMNKLPGQPPICEHASLHQLQSDRL